MSETGEIIVGLCILIAVYVMTRKIHAWRIKRAYQVIVRELEGNEAFDDQSAVELPYAKAGIFRAGMRDYRPKALEFLVASQVVGMNESGMYYLKNRDVVRSDKTHTS